MNGIGDAGAAHTTSARAATAFKFVVLDATEVSVERARLAPAGVQVACCGAKDGEGRDVSDAQLCGATAIGVWHTVWIGGALLARLPASVKLIVRFGVGFDNVDVRGCGARGIRVHNVPNYGTEEVADAALSHILNLYRSTHALAMAGRARRGDQGPRRYCGALGPVLRGRWRPPDPWPGPGPGRHGADRHGDAAPRKSVRVSLRVL